VKLNNRAADACVRTTGRHTYSRASLYQRLCYQIGCHSSLN
jgi:hypothetical protein